MDDRYQRLDYPTPGDIHCIVIYGWLQTQVTLQCRTDDENIITVHIPKLAGLDWRFARANGRLAIRTTEASANSDLDQASDLPIIVRVPKRMLEQRPVQLERRRG